MAKNTQEIDGFGGKDAPEINVSDYITKGASWLPRNCPVPISVDVMGQNLQFTFEYTCQVAEWFSGIIVAIFSFLAIRIFGRMG